LFQDRSEARASRVLSMRKGDGGSDVNGVDLSAVITWAGLGLSAAEPHAL